MVCPGAFCCRTCCRPGGGGPAGNPALLEPVGTSFRRWSQYLAQEALRPARVAERELWMTILAPEDLALTERPLDPARDTMGTSQSLSLSLPTAVTTALLTQVPARFHAQINDVLLTAFALAVADWRWRQGLGDGA